MLVLNERSRVALQAGKGTYRCTPGVHSELVEAENGTNGRSPRAKERKRKSERGSVGVGRKEGERERKPGESGRTVDRYKCYSR